MKSWLYWKAKLGEPTIVQFDDGTFGIRRGVLIHQFYDLTSRPDHYWWWFAWDNYFKTDCRGSLEEATMKLYEVQDRSLWKRLKPKRKDHGKLIVDL